MQVNRSTTRFSALLISAILVVSCVGGGADQTRLASQATRLEQRGDYPKAAAVYLRLAKLNRGAARDGYLVAAAFDLYQSGEDERARDALRRVAGPLEGNVLSRWALLNASIALLRHDAGAALEYLDQLPGSLAREDRSWATLLRGKSSFQLDQPINGIRLLLEREILLADDKALENNHQEIWNGLQQVTLHALDADRQAHSDPLIAGWLELAAAAKMADRNPFEFKSAIALWRNQFPGHPADGSLLLRIIEAYRTSTEYPQQVALLLPLTGSQQSAAQAVREGFMAAYYQQSDASLRPAIRVYDVTRLGARQAFRLAIVEGADFVVGPLTRPAVSSVAQSDTTRIKMLALNFLDPEIDIPSGFYQFALIPEDEARAVARRVAGQGLSRGLALVPDNDWGMRILNSFDEELRAQGAELLDYRTYDVGAQDFSAPIMRLLKLTDSRSRLSRLQSTLGLKLNFELRRRQDVEFIFLAARPAQGRQIRPQLKFHYAADLPVFSTSAIFSPDTARNHLLNGILFADMPWMIDQDLIQGRLHRSMLEVWPSLESRGRLFAMGFDAFRLVPLLYQGSFGEQPVSGMTGTLWLDRDRRIRRELDWAEMSGGKPQLLPPVIYDFSDPGVVDSSGVADPVPERDDAAFGN
jgi:hypothetical protein